MNATRKDFEIIADILWDEYSDAGGRGQRAVLDRLIARFANYFASQNKGFDRDKFVAACKGKKL